MVLMGGEDVWLMGGGKEEGDGEGPEPVKTHRLLLAVHSPFLRVLLATPPTSQPHLLHFPDLTHRLVNILHGLLLDLATPVASLSLADLVDLAVTADFLLATKVSSRIGARIAEVLEDDASAWPALLPAAEYVPALEPLLLHHLQRHFHSLRLQPELHRLPFPLVASLLSSDRLSARSEFHVFALIRTWLAQDTARQAHATSLINLVRVTGDGDEGTSTSSSLIDASASRDPQRCRLPSQVLVAVGGWSGPVASREVETYDVRQRKWLFRSPWCPPSLPEGRAYHAMAQLPGAVYVMGGYKGRHPFSSVLRCSLPGGAWENVAPMHSPRCYASAIHLSGRIYVAGGYDGNARLRTVENYDPIRNQWTHTSPMDRRRSDASAAQLGDGSNKFIVCGGFDGFSSHDSAVWYDSGADRWLPTSPMRWRRSGLAAIWAEGAVYVVGGNDSGRQRWAYWERFDPREGVWRPLPTSMSGPRSNLALGLLEDNLYAVGGYRDGRGTLGSVEKVDLRTLAWTQVPSLGVHRSALKLALIDTHLLVPPRSL